MSNYITAHAASSSYTIRIPRALRGELDALRARARETGIGIDFSRCASDALGKLVKDANRALDAAEEAEKAKPAATDFGSGEVEQDSTGYRP